MSYCLLQIAFDGTRAIYHACWHRINQAVHHDPAPQHVPRDAGSAAIHVPGLNRVANTKRRCMIEGCNDLQLRQIPNRIKVHLMSYYDLLIPPLARICRNHLIHIPLQDIPDSVPHRHFDFNADNYLHIRDMYVLALEQTALDFENIDEITEEDEITDRHKSN